MSRKRARCLGVASERRHDHARGTLMTRPSASRATISSAVTRTCWMRGSVLTAVLMPCLQNGCVMDTDQAPDGIHFPSAEAVAASEFDRLEPELARAPLPLDVHVWRLVAVEAGEEESIRSPAPLDP